ncbi:MAG TPA: hypothetical protein VMK16_00775 [Acidimicrobiales bacterium]|nr:hypothetical protein [Acidimicrobiales bacterium]
MNLKPGTKLRSQADSTEVVVVKAPSGDVDVRCGGHPMVPSSEAAGGLSIEPGFDGGTLVGKRYADDEVGIELLCTKAGDGALSLGVDPLPVKGAKPLPSSD